MKNTFLMISLLVTQFVLSSCGDLYSKKVKEKEVDQFATCELDTESIANVMIQNIEGDLNCLRSNLKFFIEIVKTDRPGFLSQERLEDYIKTNMEDVDQVTLDALDGIFDINTLLFGDDVGYISKKNVDNLVDVLKQFNKLVVDNKIHEYFTSDETVSFKEHNYRKSVIYSTLMQLKEVLNKYIVPNSRAIKVAEFVDKFRNLENQELVKNIESVLFIKKAFMGGDQIHLSSKELFRFIDLMGNAGKITYDFVNLPSVATKADEDIEVLRILKEDLLTVYNSFHFKDNPNEPIVSFNQIKNLVQQFLPEYAKYFKYKSTILKVKEVFLGSNSETFTAQEILTLIYDVAYKNVAKGVFIYNAYDFNESLLNADMPIVNDFNNLSPLMSSSMDKNFAELFNRISKSQSKSEDLSSRGYKYFHGSNYVPLFDYGFQRNPRGMFEVALYEYISEKTFAAYGTEDSNAVGDYVMSLEQMEVLLEDLSEFFVGEGFIIEGRAKSTAETITLISTLFHPSSNGDGRIEINEFVEFVVTMTSSLKLATDMQEELQKKCGVEGYSKIHPGCYRLEMKNFLEASVDKSDKKSSAKTRKDFLPGMYNYINAQTVSTFDTFIRSAAKFSRTCTHFEDGTEVPMSSGDFIVSWGGFLAVEQSILTFDINKTGILEPREVLTAYGVYKSAIEALIPVEFMKRYSYGIFQYMIRYQRVPEIPDITGVRSFFRALREGSHLVQFLVRPQRYRNSSADRMTFAKVLEIIAKNSPSKKENPFDCEQLRDEQTQVIQDSFNTNLVPQIEAQFAPMGADEEVILIMGGGNQIPQSTDQLPDDIRQLLLAQSKDVAGIQQQQMQAQQQMQQQKDMDVSDQRLRGLTPQQIQQFRRHEQQQIQQQY